MKLYFSDENNGKLAKVENELFTIPFGKDLGPSFFLLEGRKQTPILLKQSAGAFCAEENGISYSLAYEDEGESLLMRIVLKNNSQSDFSPEALGFKIGVDSYMVEYPQWNDVFFPTLMRCEKTHLWGYFLSPLGKAVVVTTDEPVAAWMHDYNVIDVGENDEAGHFGHRIYTSNILLLCRGPVPKRHPQHLAALKTGEEMRFSVRLTPIENLSMLSCALQKAGVPFLSLDRYTVAKGESVRVQAEANEDFSVSVVSPSGKIFEGSDIIGEEEGIYTVTLKSASGKEAEALFAVRAPYDFYLSAARRAAVAMPQKASTHTESWYGHYSAFLAKKHMPDAALDKAALRNFEEIMPYMYDFNTADVKVIPNRVQNVAALIGLLADASEAYPERKNEFLDAADRMAAFLMQNQTEDGAYRRDGAHYTSVIYIAKSMLELALCEQEAAKEDPRFTQRFEMHYDSARRAVGDLLRLGEKIGTEGEHTLEDGMISCSALQLAFFALTLPESERAPYVAAAEHLISIHRCLEQEIIPDCRMHGATLRFWEAQYDVQYRGNMMNSPHGWTSWKSYATYYLYLLTGKEAYLADTVNTLGASLLSVDFDGKLRWAFIADPYLNVKAWVKDLSRPVKDGYESADVLSSQAYRGKFEKRVFGECYVDMISDWYRAGDSKMMGGYIICPLILPGKETWVDNQGGTCDNDVHEHFKCMEETLYKKAFIILREDGTLSTYGCTATKENGAVRVTLLECTETLHVNLNADIEIYVGEKKYSAKKGLSFIRL